MEKETKLIKNTIIYAVGNLGSKLLTFLMLPIYTSFLTTEEFGAFDIIVTTVSLLLPVISFQITDGIYRFILTEDDEEKKKVLISNGAIVLFKNIGIFTLIYFIITKFINIDYFILIYLYIITMLIYTFIAQVTRGFKKNLEFAISGMIVTVITVVLNIFFIVQMNMKVEGLLISYIVAHIVAIIYIEVKAKIHKYISLKKENKECKSKLKKYSIPLIPNVVSWWVMNVSDRYMIKIFLDEGFNGIYAASNKFSSIVVIINSFFSLAWQESAILEYNSKERDEYYTRMFNAYMKFQITVAMILIAGTKIFFDVLIQKEFRDGYIIIPIMYVASIFSAFSVFYGTGYQSANDTKGSFYTTIVGAAINIGINIFAIPMLGILGAAISTLISYAVVWGIRVVQTKKYFNIEIEKKNLGILMILLSSTGVIYYIDNIYVEVSMLIASIVMFSIFNRSLILNVYKKIKEKGGVR